MWSCSLYLLCFSSPFCSRGDSDLLDCITVTFVGSQFSPGRFYQPKHWRIWRCTSSFEGGSGAAILSNCLLEWILSVSVCDYQRQKTAASLFGHGSMQTISIYLLMSYIYFFHLVPNETMGFNDIIVFFFLETDILQSFVEENKK